MLIIYRPFRIDHDESKFLTHPLVFINDLCSEMKVTFERIA